MPKAVLIQTNFTAGELSHLDRAKKYQAEHKCSITEALKATAEPRK